MRLSVAVVADRAVVHPNGTMDVIGIQNAKTFPNYPVSTQVNLVLRFDVEPLDLLDTIALSIAVLDEDDTEQVVLTAEPIRVASAHRPGTHVVLPQIVPISINIPAPCVWTFDVRVGERSLARVPLQFLAG
jgi:hypothetical protein